MSAKKNSPSDRSAKSRKRSSPAALDPLATASSADATMFLALASPAVRAPSAAVKSSLLARIRASNVEQQRGEGAAPPTGWRFEKAAGKEGWVTLPIPGLRMREMTVDAERDTALIFVEMAPGAVFPDHTHSVTERGFVLSGDLQMDGRLLGAGDFYEAAAGTRHARVSSPSGCTGLIWVGAEAWRRWRKLAGVR